MAIGPVMPPGVQATQDDSSDDEYGPALPPDMLPAAPSASANASASRVTLGPSRPRSASQPDDADGDDEVGPAPPPTTSTSTEDDAVRSFLEREQRQAKADSDRLALERDGAPLKRDDWMLAPPSSSSLLGSLDTTKLKSRSFAAGGPSSSSKGKGKGKKKDGEVDLWTETPQERQRRLRDEAMGVRKRAEKGAADDGDDDDDDGEGLTREERRRRKERDDELRAQVDQYNKRTRKETLLDLHDDERSKKRRRPHGDGAAQEGGDDAGPPAIWDRERDMSVRGGMFDPNKRRDMIKDAKGLGGRFGGGTFL